MSIPKEPRQLMINIMYLVLTALLALNVSAEILNAFIAVNKGIDNSNKAIISKNDFIYKAFSAKAREDGREESLDLLERADLARKYSTEFNDYITNWQDRIISNAGGYIEGHEGNPKYMKGKKDVETPTNMLVEKGGGDSIKSYIETYHDKFISLFDEIDRSEYKDRLTLSILEPEDKSKDWKTYNFRKVPVAAVNTILTKFKNDAIAAESTVLDYLSKKVGETDFKFDQLSAKVIAPTSYLIKGREYTADIFLAATSEQIVPEIYLGTFTSAVKPVKQGEGVVPSEYEVIEGPAESMPLTNARPLEVEGGMGKFRTTASGSSRVTGVIKMMKPNTDLFQFFPFELKYETFETGQVVISPTAMNVLYIGVDNPVDISAGNAEPSSITASGCGISRATGIGKYVARPTTPGIETVYVQGKSKEGEIVKGQMEFRIKRIPDPYAYCGRSKGGTIKAGELKVLSGLIARNEDFVFDLQYNVKGFEMIYAPARGSIFSSITKGNRFNSEMQQVFGSKVRPGDTVIFTNIKVGMPDGTTRTLSLSLKVI